MVIATYESIQIFSIESGPEGLSLKPTDFVLGTDGILVRSVNAHMLVLYNIFMVSSYFAQKVEGYSLAKAIRKSQNSATRKLKSYSAC